MFGTHHGFDSNLPKSLLFFENIAILRIKFVVREFKRSYIVTRKLKVTDSHNVLKGLKNLKELAILPWFESLPVPREFYDRVDTLTFSKRAIFQYPGKGSIVNVVYSGLRNTLESHRVSRINMKTDIVNYQGMGTKPLEHHMIKPVFLSCWLNNSGVFVTKTKFL